MPRLASVLALAVVLGPSPAGAQAVPPPAQPPPRALPSPGPQAPSAPAPPPAGVAQLPDLPEVEDPMLVPVPEAPSRLSSWRDALKITRSRSAALRISQARVLQAQGQARVALAGTLPRLTGTASLNRHLLFGTGTNFGSEGFDQNAIIPDPATNFNAGLEFRQPLLALGTWYAIGTANRQERAAELSAKDTERVILGTVAEAAVTVITSERVAEVSRVSLRSVLSTLDLTRRRANLGASSVVDVLRAEQEVSLARSQVVSADEAVRRARESLGLTIGDDRPWGVSPNVNVQELAATAREVCTPVPNADARTDVQAASMNVEIAERGTESVRYGYAPTLDLTSSFQYTNNVNRSVNGEHVTWTVGALFTWPIYDGGSREGERTRAQGQTIVAQQELADIRRNANVQIVQARRAIQVAIANVEVSTKTRDITKESARLAKIAFINGTGTSFDLVDNERRWREAEIDLAIKEFELVRAEIAAFLAQSNCSF